MPELPEVHTTVEGLRKVIIGKTIKDVWSDFHIGAKYGDRENIKNKKYLEKFKKIVIGTKIKNIARRGKNILINLSNDYTVIVHMKMTGNLMYGLYPNNKFIHLIFNLSDNPSTDSTRSLKSSSGQVKNLVLADMRKFASVDIFKTKELGRHQRLGGLGVDPLDPKLTVKNFFEIIHKKTGPIKSVLLDQSVIAGLGNIYTDEILWQTDIHPLSKAGKIPEKKFAEIFKAMQKILNFSIKHGGDSKSDYRNAFGEKGNFQNFHKVYSRKGERCSKPKCSGIIERIVVKGRSAHFCPKHQIIYK